MEWFGETERQIQDAESICSDPDKLRTRLSDHKVRSECIILLQYSLSRLSQTLNDDISSQKSKARDVISAAKRLRRESTTEEDPVLKDKMDDLKAQADSVAKLSADRLSALEQALPLALHFQEIHDSLEEWLDAMETETSEHPEQPAINAEQIKEQQDHVKLMKQKVADQKPVLDRLNKTGGALLKLVGDENQDQVQDTLETDSNRFDDIKNSIRERSNSLDEALQQTSEFSDQLENMLEMLNSTADQVEGAEPISAHPDKLKDQVDDNEAIMEDVAKRLASLDAVTATAKELMQQTGMEDANVKELKDKVDALNDAVEKITNQTADRKKLLDMTLEVAEKFWDDLNSLMEALKELQDSLDNQEVPALEPRAIRDQQEVLQVCVVCTCFTFILSEFFFVFRIYERRWRPYRGSWTVCGSLERSWLI